MDYNFREIEKKWQNYWRENATYKVEEDKTKEKYYVLDMFPYPSGAGLHVGHPLGYIASDIFSRYKRLKGYNVLHPMGYDSFGLPAEQYAIQTGQHPAITTSTNIDRYREQLDKIGFSFDWSREVRTSDPSYYRWTQWIFKQLFNSWYNLDNDKAEDITELIVCFENDGNKYVNAVSEFEATFSAQEWKSYSEKEKEGILQEYRLTYLSDTMVNWCEALGTVLANDEIKDGLSERGGHPVVQKTMRQWSMRITAYAERLLQGLNKIDFSDSLKEQQRNWIGKSEGASITFSIDGHDAKIEVFSTRPDTIFGASFMVLAPEHELVSRLTTASQKSEIEDYQEKAAAKSERDRMSNVKEVSGAFTGAYALHPFNGNKIPIWIADYVLAGYGTGAVMAVPAGDQRDYDFAKHFDIIIPPIFKGIDIDEGANAEKTVTLENSDFLNDLKVTEATQLVIEKLEAMGIGEGKINYRLRDAIFSRQRYWGEPFPVYFENEIPKLLDDNELPLTLPPVDKYLPTESGEPPLARAKKGDWPIFKGDRMETNTMPGWAGSAWYFLRYMDSQNESEFVSREKADYWNQVDLYIGGSEHAVGHLLYSRFWTKFLYDRGYIGFDEPYKKLINQGMILGESPKGIIIKKEVKNIANPTENSPNRKDSLGYEIAKPDWHLDIDKHYDHILFPLSLEKHVKGILDFKKQTIPIDFVEHNKENFYSTKKLIGQLRNTYGHLNNLQIGTLSDLQEICLNNNVSLDFDSIKLNGETVDLGFEIEKMGKSKFNAVNPDDLVEKFGADTLRCYEMFLGPLEQAKPWDTQGISGVHNFLRRFWNLSHAEGQLIVSDEKADKKALKSLHKTIQKVEEDIKRYSFNTVVSALMICVNELNEQKCNNRGVIQDLTVILSPYAPHIAEEMWNELGNKESISKATFPTFNPDYLVEDSTVYPVSFNGKMRFQLEVARETPKDEVEKLALGDDRAAKWLEGKTIRKVIVVPGKIVNVVVG